MQRRGLYHQPCHARGQQSEDCEIGRVGPADTACKIQGHEGSAERYWRFAEHDALRLVMAIKYAVVFGILMTGEQMTIGNSW